ncbi:hypothetical protein M5D96_011223, partial [Drosophila gunungcola]
MLIPFSNSRYYEMPFGAGHLKSRTAQLADHLVVVERQTCPPLTLNNTPLPQADDV